MLKNVWFQAHWLIGITAGIILAIVGLTGGILSFETEIQAWLNRDVRKVEASAAGPLAPAALIDAVLARAPDKRVASLQLSGDPSASARVTFAPPGREANQGGGGGRGGARGETRYVNPYTGVLIEGDATRGQTFFRTTRSIHRWLTAGEWGNHRAIGKQIVGASTVLCVVLALSGLYLRWPRHAGNWRTWLTFDPALKGRSFLWHLHAVLGTWVLVGFLLMSLTGLYWSYDWYRNGLYAISGVERPAPRGGPERERAAPGRESGANRAPRSEAGADGGQAMRSADVAPQADLHAIWNAFLAHTTSTGFGTATLTLPQQGGRPIEIRYIDADPAHERANNTIAFDPRTAALVRHERYDDKRAGEKFMSSIFPLHSGSFFGLPGVVAYMIASLAMPVFAITGWMLYLDRRRKKKAARAAEGSTLATGTRAGSRGVGTSSGEPLLVGFASQAGFARSVAWQTAGALQAAGIAVDVQPLERLDRERLSRTRQALFVVSTFGEGEPPDAARSFARRLMREPVSLAGLRFGVLALGDRQYKTFCEFGRTLDRWLRGQGARPLFPPVEVDKGDPLALDNWRTQLGTFANGATLGDWKESPFQDWRLAERRVLNPGSLGGPTFHLELEAEHAAAAWQAGDIAEVQIATADGAVTTREFSIASVPADGRVHLVVRQVRKADGALGIGSGWLTESAPLGARVQMRIRSNPSFHGPTDDRPLILIGNGTGIAGLRSHLKARALRGQSKNWLIFGERQHEHDLYYRTELEAWQSQGLLTRMDLAFSRDQPERVYVQHRLREQVDRLREWVAEGAALYVCGSAEGMAPDVHAALNEILGEAAVERLTEEGRYRRDVY